jgi:hypothetical protein
VINEYDIRTPKFTPAEMVRLGKILAGFLPYPTPVSVHRASGPWVKDLNTSPSWNDHVIIQQKIRNLPEAADVLQSGYVAGGANKPVINDELSYDGVGDKHSEGDTIESHLGAFLGGGYGTTGHKTGVKTGQYFPGAFDPAAHTAADNLKWLRETIDSHVRFWTMQPGATVFSNLHADFRAVSGPEEFVLGTNKPWKDISVNLPEGRWDVVLYDGIAKEMRTLVKNASGRATFDSPDSRAALIHVRKSNR